MQRGIQQVVEREQVEPETSGKHCENLGNYKYKGSISLEMPYNAECSETNLRVISLF